MKKRLVVLAGPDEGRVFPLGIEPLLVGRSRATDTQLVDPHVARVHCQLQFQGGQYILTDFESDAGTFVNGVRVGEHKLQVGDIIHVGDSRLQFLDDDTPGSPTSPPSGSPRRSDVNAPSSPERWDRVLPGQKFGQFKIGQMFARGLLGCVFHARHMRKNLDIALKVLDPKFGNDDQIVQRFVQAMKSLLPLRHPNLILVHSAGKTGPHCWVAMEYLRTAECLGAVIGRVGTTGLMDWKKVLRLLIYVTRALVHAHGKNIIHQSVTPRNILVGKDLARTKLVDLMLASTLACDPTTPLPSGEPSPSLPFMSPERTDGPAKPIDARTDIYSLGATAYAMLTGQPPFQADKAQELVAKIRLQSPPSLKLLHFGIPESFESSILKMLAKRPEDRQQSAQELLTELELLAETHAVVC